MKNKDEITKITSRVIREYESYKNDTVEPMKIDDKVVQVIGMIVEECIDNSLKFAAHNSISKNSNEIEKRDISYYIESNYNIGEKDIND